MLGLLKGTGYISVDKPKMGWKTYLSLSLQMFLLCKFCTVKCATDLDVERLISDLSTGYPKHTRPPRDQSKSVSVLVGFYLAAIREFDEVNERFSVIGTLVISWQDERLKWNVTEYNGVETFLVDNNVFWTPPIFVQNAIDEFKKIGEDPYWRVRFYYYGIASFYPGNVFTTVCTPEVQLFPFDRQMCYLSFSLIGYLANEITLQNFDDYIDPMLYFEGDGLWDVESAGTYTVQNTVSIGFYLKRKPILAIINIILPIMLMSFLNIMVFLIPAESGERISFSLTVLLALAVFLTLVSDSMPKSATSIAYLSYYLVAILVLSILITIATIVSLKLYHQDEDKKIPKCLQALTRCLLCKRRKSKHKTPYSDTSVQTDGPYTGNSQHLGTTNNLNINTITIGYKTANRMNGQSQNNRSKVYLEGQNGYQDGQKNVDRVSQSNRDPQIEYESPKEEEITWKSVSVLFDVLFFVIALILVVVFTLTYFIYVNTRKNTN